MCEENCLEFVKKKKNLGDKTPLRPTSGDF
jgi:hypothetical protein